MTEKEKMLAGEVYSAIDAQLLEELAAARDVIHEYNLLRPSESAKKLELLKGLLTESRADSSSPLRFHMLMSAIYCIRPG